MCLGWLAKQEGVMATEEVSEEKQAKLCHEEDEEESQREHKNKFVNDGSFLELFRKKMTEKQESSQKKTSSDPTAVTGHQQSLKLIQAGVGRPKALMKSIELREKRKRRREELEVYSICISISIFLN